MKCLIALAIALSGTSVQAQSLSVDSFAGVDAAAKINACVSALPASGGLCDARNVIGNQTFGSTINVGAASGPKVVQLLLGNAYYTCTVTPCIVITRSSQILGVGRNGGTIVQSDGAAPRTLIQAFQPYNGESRIMIDNLELRLVVTGDVGIDASTLDTSVVSRVLIDKLGGSPLGTGIQAVSTSSATRNYRNEWHAVELVNLATGVLLTADASGNGPNAQSFLDLVVNNTAAPVVISTNVNGTVFWRPDIEISPVGGTAIANGGGHTLLMAPFIESWTVGIANSGASLVVINPVWGANGTNIAGVATAACLACDH